MKVISKLIATIVLLLCVFNTSAQIDFGLKAGVNWSTTIQKYAESDLESNFQYKPGFCVGVISNYKFSDKISVQTGVVFTSKGNKIDEYSTTNVDEHEVNIHHKVINTYNYIEIPLDLVYNHKSYQFYIGSYFAFGLDGTASGEVKYKYFDGTEFVDKIHGSYKAFLRKVDLTELDVNDAAFYGMDIGLKIGLGIKLMNDAAVINAEYSMGLSNVNAKYDRPTSVTRADNKDSNRVVTLSFTYFFGN